MPEPYTHTANGRTWRLYGCARRGCDRINLDYESFGAGDKGYCLDHIPLRSRVRLWWQERRPAFDDQRPKPDEHCGYTPETCPYGDACADCGLA